MLLPMYRLSLLITLLAAALVSAGCKKTPPANVSATVNDRAITFADLEKQFGMQFPPQPGQSENDDQTMINKLEVLRSMIDQEIMMQRAEKNGLLAQQADVDADFAKLKGGFTEEEFKKRLEEKKMTAEDLKSDIRKKLSIEKLITKEITSKINITDKDVSDFYASNKQNFNLAEPQVHLAQILTTPVADASIRNLKNDKAQNDDQAKRKMQQISDRLRAGEDFSMLASRLLRQRRRPRLRLRVGSRKSQHRSAQARQPNATRPNLPRHQDRRRLSHPETPLEGARRPARTQRPPRTTDHPRDAHEP
ncbi:MAG: SurA N-terminal domain-containing protein [Acidobacteria bacterium]|nr:SurA N-terminal domain-containing protein [Acidobacteriota bacterium]